MAWGILDTNFPVPPDINKVNIIREKEERSTNLIDKVIKESVSSLRSRIKLNLLDEDKFKVAAYQKMEK